MTNGNDGGWGASGAGGSDWEDWNSPPAPETNQFEAIDWFDNQGAAAGAGQARWYGQGDPSHWNQPTEQQPRKKTWPIVVGVAIGAVVLLAAGGVGLLIAGGEDDYVIATEAASTSTSGTAGWTSSAPTTTTRESQVVPATSGSSCSKSDLARDMGWSGVNHLECYGDWAVAFPSNGRGHGNVYRLVNGTWTATEYGLSSCSPESAKDIVPAALADEHLIFCGSSSSRSNSSRKSSTTRRPATRTTTRTTTRTSTRTTTVQPEAPAPVIEVTIAPDVPDVQPEPTTSAAPTTSSQPTSAASAAQATSQSAAARQDSDEG